MKIKAIEPHKRKVIVSAISGLLCFLLSPYGIEITWDAVTINLPWSIVFPILISMVYGWKYGLIAGLSGGALFPFYLWFNNGYPNLTTTIIYLILYCLLGLASNQKIIKDIKNLDVRILIVFIVSVFIFKIYYKYIFNYLLSVNPPFWSNKSINFLSPEILNGFFIKECINFLAFIFISSTLIKIPFVRQIFNLEISAEMKNNGKIFLYSIILAFLVWFSYFLLGNSLLHDKNVLNHESLQLALFVILAAGLIVARIITYYSEIEIKSKFELIESEKKYKSLTENSIDYIMRFDSNHRHLYINQITYDLLQIKPEQLLNKTHRESGLFNPEQCDFWEQSINKVFETNEIVQIQFDFFNGKETIYYDWMLIPEKNDNGNIEYVLSVSRDISKLKQYEKELIEAKEKAEESDRLKTAFLQNMSHEIRTPMNAIMGFSSLLTENFNNRAKIESFSKIIELRCNDLLDIINDILDVSKIESGESTISVENCNIKELFDELGLFLNEYKGRINKHDIKIIFHPAPDDSLKTIKTDTLKLKQVIINLVSNALKFTEAGSITCGYKYEDGKIQFYVRDTGIGISEEKYDYIFERFSQLKHPSLQNVGGTGLGLPIVKGLVKLLGGDVWLESECNKGSTFYFTIDYIKADSINI